MKFGMKKNEEAVSPVIGVILMVVITVIIAAILAVFAFGIGGPQKSPEVNLRFTAVDDGTNTTLKISHEGGDALILKDEKMTVTFAADGSDAIIGGGATPVAVALNPAIWQTTLLDTLAAGQVVVGELFHADTPAGTIIEVKIVDTPTGQLISKVRVVVQ
jgi:archaeal type IV pilus assembly protein PilA